MPRPSSIPLTLRRKWRYSHYEELGTIGKLIEAAKDNDGEIPDELAEQVAGGAFDVSQITNWIKTITGIMAMFGDFIGKIASLFNGEGEEPKK